MKKFNVLMLSALYVLLIAIMTVFTGCEKTPDDPPTPDATEVVFKGILNSPNGCSVINDKIHIVITADNGVVLKDFYLKSNETKTFKGDEAKSLIGKEYTITASGTISQNGNLLPTAIEPDTLVKTVAKGENANTFTLTAISQTTEVSFQAIFNAPAGYAILYDGASFLIEDGATVLQKFDLKNGEVKKFVGQEAEILLGKNCYVSASASLMDSLGVILPTKITPEYINKPVTVGENITIFSLSTL